MGSGTRLLACLLLTCLAPSPCTPAKPVTLELRGQVLNSRGKALPLYSSIWVNLQGSTTPFSNGTQALGGKFKFSKLLPGTYTVRVQVRAQGQAYQTVDVTPGLADRKGRVHVKVLLRPAVEDAQQRHTVSTRQLSINAAAVDEFRKAQKSLSKREVDQAIKHLEKAIEHSPAFLEAVNWMGTIYYQRRDFKKAEELFRKALALDSNAYEPMVNLGGTLLGLNRFREALAYNIESTNRRPNDALAHSQLGINLMALGRYDNAIEYLKRAKELDPAHFSHPQLLLAEIYARQGRMAQSRAELEEFVRLHPDDPLAGKLREGLKQIKKQ